MGNDEVMVIHSVLYIISKYNLAKGPHSPGTEPLKSHHAELMNTQ